MLDQRKKARLVNLNFISFNMYYISIIIPIICPSLCSISIFLSYRAWIVENSWDITMIFRNVCSHEWCVTVALIGTLINFYSKNKGFDWRQAIVMFNECFQIDFNCNLRQFLCFLFCSSFGVLVYFILTCILYECNGITFIYAFILMNTNTSSVFRRLETISYGIWNSVEWFYDDFLCGVSCTNIIFIIILDI